MRLRRNTLDPRRKKAVILAVLPTCSLSMVVALMPAMHGNRRWQVIMGLWLVVALFCLVMALRELMHAQRDGDAGE